MIDKKVPHVHAELIKAWADGTSIQRYNNTLQQWKDCNDLLLDWNPCTKYRVKPEPKPDVVLYAMIEAVPEFGHAKIRSVHADVHKIKSDTCMFVFDGETGALKDCQILVKE